MTDIHQSTLERFERLEKASNDVGHQNVVIEACRRDPVLWVNDWVWTTDPRNAARGLPINVPFILFPKQEEYIRWRRECVDNRKFGIIAKSRDSGISWLNCADQLHRWLFSDDYKSAFGSRKEGNIDKLGDPDTIFQKMRFILGMLPTWMKPKKFSDSYMRLINHDKNSVVTGESGDNIGRGGRNSVYDVDEFAYVEHQTIVLAALSQNTDTVILTSTPNGNSNEFATIYQSDSEGYKRFTFHWKDDPRKNKWIAPDGTTGNGWDSPIGAVYPWYEEQKSKLDELTIAREIDIDFSSSQENICIPAKWVQSAIDFPIVMTNYKLQAGLDVATEEGKDKTVLTIVDGGNKVIHIEDWKGLNTTQTAYRAIEICNRYNVDALIFDCDGVGFGVSATLQNTPNLRFRVKAFHGGGSPSSYYWQLENKSSRDKFANRKAELWHLLSIRFQKTYETRNNIRIHPTDECISIPNHTQLINELSMPTMNYKENGQLILQSKKTMSKSPDFADSLVLASASENDSSSFMTSTAHYS